MNQFNISIPKPCHEDWQQMTTEERGRFCNVCNKTVLDFSNKSTTEINQYVAAHADEKMCGRFRTDQISTPVKIEIPVQQLYRRLSPFQAFVAAVLLVFGTSLFSCTNHKSEVVGEIALKQDYVWNDSINNNQVLNPQIVDVSTNCFTTGVMAYPMDSVEEPVVTEVKGDLKIDVDSLKWELQPADVTATSYQVSDCNFILGGLGIQVILDNEQGVEIDSSIIEIQNKVVDENFQQQVFPNPTNGNLTVKLNSKSEQKVQIELYDLNGKHLRNLVPLQLMEPSEYNIQLDLSDMPSGIYLLRTLVDDKVNTEKIILEK